MIGTIMIPAKSVDSEIMFNFIVFKYIYENNEYLGEFSHFDNLYNFGYGDIFIPLRNFSTFKFYKIFENDFPKVKLSLCYNKEYSLYFDTLKFPIVCYKIPPSIISTIQFRYSEISNFSVDKDLFCFCFGSEKSVFLCKLFR